jgi:glycosyltransferase involved in cell wall biosynthesis
MAKNRLDILNAKNDLISVLVCMYNSSKTIKETISSIQNQTYKNIEIVVMDDESKDNSYDIVEEMAKEDERIKLYKKENQKCVAYTRNALLDKINGKYYVFVDSDDIVSPKFIEFLYFTIIDKNVDVAVCGFTLLKEVVNRPIYLFDSVQDNKGALSKITYTDNNVVVWNKMVRTELVKDLRFKPLHYGEDLMFNIDLFENPNIKVGFIRSKLYFYRLFNNGISKGSFGQKQVDFLNSLIELENDPSYSEYTRNSIKGWTYITANYFSLLLIGNKKYKDYRKNEITKILEERKHIYKNEKRVRSWVRIGLGITDFNRLIIK